MKRTGRRSGRWVFFVTALVVLGLTVLSFTGIRTIYGDKETVYINGVQDIRWGIDIRGGVDATFTAPEDVDPTEEQMNAAAEVIKQRLILNGVVDYEVYTDVNNGRIIVRYPWRADQEDTSATAVAEAIDELGATAMLTFREGTETDEDGNPTGVTGTIIVEGSHVISATALYGDATGNGTNQYFVSLEFDSEGAEAFAEATTRLASENGILSIWMDNQMISYPTVNDPITDGKCVITGNFTREEAEELANTITAGALPFALVNDTYGVQTPTLGVGALEAMVIAGVIAFVLVSIYMILLYRLPGLVAVIALAGHVGGMIFGITRILPGIPSLTLTIPGIAGIILSIGMGVDANVITAERIKEEVRGGKSIEGSVATGFKRGFTAIFDGNITVLIVAIILMGAFGAPNDPMNPWTTLLNPIFFMFGPSAQGSIYSFGYTLLVGVILNFLFSVLAARLMLKSLVKFSCFRNPWFYGGAKSHD